MDPNEKDEGYDTSEIHEERSSDHGDSQFQKHTSFTNGTSWSLSMDYPPSYVVGFTGPLRSRKQTSLVQFKENHNYGERDDLLQSKQLFDFKVSFSFYGDSQGGARTFCSFLYSCIPGIMIPAAKCVQWWNQFVVISCLASIFIDPLFFFVVSVHQDDICIVIHRTLANFIVVFRSIADAIYFLHIVLTFMLAYVAPESRVVRLEALVEQPTKIAIRYFTEYFFVDLFAVLPLPQVAVLFVLPDNLSSFGGNYAKNLVCAALLVQYIARLYRFLHLLVCNTGIGFIFESAWANFVINLLMFLLSGHVVGSGWYLFGLQRVSLCLRDLCNHNDLCKFIDCGYGSVQFDHSDSDWIHWNDTATTACLTINDNGFKYGIYQQVVSLTTEQTVITRYVYSLFWGFQQISTLAGNLAPSHLIWEVLFTMAIAGVGLLLFAFLVGNMQNFLQSLGQRKSEMSLRRRDVEKWMSRQRFPEYLRRKVREAEQYSWATSRGVNDETMMESLPEGLQSEIRQHIFRFLRQVRIFSLMEEPILDVIHERLRHKHYVRGSCILYPGSLIEKMVLIVRGKMESIGEDGAVSLLSENSTCGEELLIWYLETCSMNRDVNRKRFYGERPYSTKVVKCLTNVEAFVLRAEDLEEVTKCFCRFFRNSRVQRAIRYETPCVRCFAATGIQVAWRYRRKRLDSANIGT